MDVDKFRFIKTLKTPLSYFDKWIKPKFIFTNLKHLSLSVMYPERNELNVFLKKQNCINLANIEQLKCIEYEKIYNENDHEYFRSVFMVKGF